MNDVYIFAEFLTLKSEKDINPNNFAAACGVTTRITYDWIYNRQIPDKYLNLIANYYKNPFFNSILYVGQN